MKWSAETLAVRMDELEKRLDERWRAQEAQSSSILREQKDYNEHSNEFRGALEDQAARIERDSIPRREYDSRHDALVSDVNNLRDESRKDDIVLHELISDLRTEIAAGPSRLAEKRSATFIAVVAAMSGFVYIITALLTHGFR